MTTTKHTILFLAASPHGTDPRALDRAARAIHAELERSGHRDRFDLVTRWATEPLDLLRELRTLRPTIVHFSGRGGLSPSGEQGPNRTANRDIASENRRDPEARKDGLFLQGSDGRARWVSARALQDTFGAAGSSVQVVVLDACHSAGYAEALLAEVDCVVGMPGTVDDDAARSFAIGFYGGLGDGESITTAYRQGCAAIHLEGLADADHPRLAVRDGTNPDTLVLAAEAAPGGESAPAAPDAHVTDTQGRPMTRDELLTRLSELLPSQFDEVLFRVNIPEHHLPGATSAQAARAIAAIRFVEQQRRFEQLVRTVEEVVTGRRGALRGPDGADPT